MQLECVCGTFHDLSETAMILVITAYQNGKMTSMRNGRLRVRCMLTAFTDEAIRDIKKKYPKRLLVAE
jgi:hypothetical protein